MQIRCPHCQNGIELVDDSDFQNVDCPSCGSQFGLVDVGQNEIDTLSKSRGAKDTIGHFELIEEVGRGLLQPGQYLRWARPARQGDFGLHRGDSNKARPCRGLLRPGRGLR